MNVTSHCIVDRYYDKHRFDIITADDYFLVRFLSHDNKMAAICESRIEHDIAEIKSLFI